VTKILKHVRVVEMGTFITGPAAAMHLADLGADVIKVERPGEGDPFRAFKGGLYSPHYQTYNRNKRSIALDTGKPEDKQVFHDLIATADVFIQNFRPGVAEKLGAGEEELRAINPRLVYCAISGFGASGPSRDRPAFDTVAQAASGFLRLVVPPQSPRVIGPAIADAITGFYAALGIVAALHERDAGGGDGKGRRIDISMLEAMCHFNLDSFTHYFSVGEVMTPLSRPTVSQSYTFECADGKWIALHLSSPPKFWEGLMHAIGRPELIEDPRFKERPGRIAGQDELIAIMAPIFKTKSRDAWCAILLEKEVPHSPAYDSNEALDDPQAKHLRIKVSAVHPEMGPFTTVRSPFSFDGEPERDVLPPPTLDEHGAEIRAELKRRRVD
jgi:crotonobetainyl-CoA:carnitine CoA-transferase CaiB-like acyl-CoA transferase